MKKIILLIAAATCLVSTASDIQCVWSSCLAEPIDSQVTFPSSASRECQVQWKDLLARDVVAESKTQPDLTIFNPLALQRFVSRTVYGACVVPKQFPLIKAVDDDVKAHCKTTWIPKAASEWSTESEGTKCLDGFFRYRMALVTQFAMPGSFTASKPVMAHSFFSELLKETPDVGKLLQIAEKARERFSDENLLYVHSELLRMSWLTARDEATKKKFRDRYAETVQRLASGYYSRRTAFWVARMDGNLEEMRKAVAEIQKREAASDDALYFAAWTEFFAHSPDSAKLYLNQTIRNEYGGKDFFASVALKRMLSTDPIVRARPTFMDPTVFFSFGYFVVDGQKMTVSGSGLSKKLWESEHASQDLTEVKETILEEDAAMRKRWLSSPK